jgi:uncharacterized protein GlcG (DUF336 family)
MMPAVTGRRLLAWGCRAMLALMIATPGLATANPLPQQQRLSSGEVALIVRQAVAEAQARNAAAHIAVTDRVGNVLAVYAMSGAEALVEIDAGREVVQPAGLVGLSPLEIAPVAAIAKAITGAYLSSDGNAFSSRTASMIVQENFVPGSRLLEGGPLFGVQFSQLPCSDLSVRFASDTGGTIHPRIGPKRSPLGLSADPGGLPLYKGGVLVGGLGVLADGTYGLDRNVRNRDRDLDELIAIAGSIGFDAPVNLRADRVTVDGRSLRYADRGPGALLTRRADANQIDLAAAGAFVQVNGYYPGGVPITGTAFGFGQSGILPDPDNLFANDRAFVLADATGANRFPPQAGTDGPGALTAAEVTRLLRESLGVALAARGQIQRPLGNHAEVTISVVDTTGAILGIVRTPNGPLFGTDVSLQKARSAMFFSNPEAPADLAGTAPPALPGQFRSPAIYVDRVLDFFGRPDALGGSFAYGNRSIGNMARPFFPDGRNGSPEGPLSVPFESWSPFNTGLQLDLVANDIVTHLLGLVATGSGDTQPQCAGLPRLANGLQIFSGGVPIYRNGVLVGGIGVSGDGIDQDDMIAFLGLHRAGRVLNTGIGNAPRAIRSDRLSARGAHLRYVQCPFAPFLGSDRQNVCQGL